MVGYVIGSNKVQQLLPHVVVFAVVYLEKEKDCVHITPCSLVTNSNSYVWLHCQVKLCSG